MTSTTSNSMVGANQGQGVLPPLTERQVALSSAVGVYTLALYSVHCTLHCCTQHTYSIVPLALRVGPFSASLMYS